MAARNRDRDRSRSPRLAAPAAPDPGFLPPLASHNRGDNPSWGTVSIKTHVTFPTYQTCIEVQSTAATFRERDITYVHDIPGQQPTAGAMPPPKSVSAATAGRPPPKAESAAGAGVVVAGSPPPKAESAA